MKRKNGIQVFLFIIAGFLFLSILGLWGCFLISGPIRFEDPIIEDLIRQQIYKPKGEIFPSDVDMIREINARNLGISSIKGLQSLKGLRNLYLQNNDITDITPISRLPGLDRLGLAGNRITDFSSLAWMIPSLEFHDFEADDKQVQAEAPNTSSGLVINEVMVSNFRNYYDKLDLTSDWIELRNMGTKPVSLAGYGLSDETKNPFKFRFPSLIVPGGGFVLVWASGTEYSASLELHAKFKLKQKGETLILTSRNGQTIDWLKIPELKTNQSYGRMYSSPKQWAVMAESSPGKPNTDALIEEKKVEPITSNFPTGYYPEGMELLLSTGNGTAEIHYTFDGSIPDLSSSLYSGPLAISKALIPADSLTAERGITEYFLLPTSIKNRALVVRARAFQNGLMPSDCFSAVYFFNDIHQIHTMPVLSLTAQPNDLMDSEDGIYQLGNVYAQWKKNNPGKTYQGDSPANYNRRGDAWRIPAKAEFFDGQNGFAVDAEMKIVGGWSRANAQKSFQLLFHGQDDATGGLNYELFPGLRSRDGKGRKVDFFRSVILRNGGNDWPFSLFRDPLISDLVNDFPLDTQSSRPVVVYLNGEYWGILSMQENFEEGYFYSHYRVPMDQVAVLEGLTLIGDGTPRLGTAVDFSSYGQLVAEIENTDFSTKDSYLKFNKRIDLKNHALYTAIETWIANLDWPGNNIRYWKYTGSVGTESEIPGFVNGLDGRYRWLLYDTEFSFNMYDSNMYNHNMFLTITQANGPDWPNPPWSTILFRQFIKNPEYKRQLVNACCDLMNSVFNYETIAASVESMTHLYSPEMSAHQLRWAGSASGSLQGWINSTNSILDFAKKRNPVFKGHMASFFRLKDPAPVSVFVSQGGKVLLNYLTLSPGTFKGQYYMGNAVDLTALPDPGWVFVGWNGSVTTDQETLSLDPAGGLALSAIFLPVP